MTHDDAESLAQERADKQQMVYCIVLIPNGQWMVEREDFMHSKKGKAVYGKDARRIEYFGPRVR